MKMFPAVFCRSMQVLAVALLGSAGCQQTRAQSAEAALTAPATLPVPAVEVTTPTLKPQVAAHLVTPVIKASKSGSGVRIKTGVALTNEGGVSAKNVTVTAYLSDDATLSADDTSLGTIQLATYKSKGNLKPTVSFTVPLSYKVPGALVEELQGKYLIFVPSADGFTADPTTGVAVFGPIRLP